MFRSIGTVIVLLVLVNFFGRTFTAMENAIIASFQAVEMAAEIAKTELEAQQQ